MSDLKELIEATENVSLIQEAKNFLRKLERIDNEAYEYVQQEIKENICLDSMFEAGMSDEKVRSVFSELNKSWSHGVNEYLKGKRDEFDV